MKNRKFAVPVSRRSFVLGAGAALMVAAKRSANGQLVPFRILIQREETWPDAVGITNCVLGKLYVVQEFPSTDGVVTEAPLGSTLELPWRNNQNDISRILAGMYKAHTREDGDLGWRIQLEHVDDRDLVEIHIGNYPRNTIGCILFGLGRSSSDGCMVTDSGVAMDRLGSAYGSSDRDIEIVIRDA